MVALWLIAQAGLLIIEGWLLMTLPDRPMLLLSGHTLTTLLYAIAFGRSLASLYPQQGTALLGGILAFFLPVAGIFCAFLTALLCLYKPLPAGDLLKEFKEHTTLPDIINPKQKVLAEEKDVLQAYRDLEPLVDMLSTPDPQLKRAVLDAIAKSKNSKLIPHILEALEDPRPEIYQFAIAKVTQLQHDYGLEIARAMDKAKADPENLGAHRRLAEVYRQYLKSGLADQSVMGFYQDQLQQEYEKILSLSPKDCTILKSLAQLFLENKKWEEAGREFKKARSLKPNDLEAQFGLIKVLYGQKEYGKMFEQFHRVREELVTGANDNQILGTLTEWWLSPEEETVEATK